MKINAVTYDYEDMSDSEICPKSAESELSKHRFLKICGKCL